MATWLLTYNPLKSRSWTVIDEDLQAILQGKHVPTRWSTGHTKSVQPGDAVFFLRQGKKPTGIFARGIATSACYEDVHWSESGHTANYALFEVLELVSPESPYVLEVATLKDCLPAGNWQPMASGASVRPSLCKPLEALWRVFYQGCRGRGHLPLAVEDATDGVCDEGRCSDRIARIRVFGVDAAFHAEQGWSSEDQRVTEMLLHCWLRHRVGGEWPDPMHEEVRRVAEACGGEVLHIDPGEPIPEGAIL